MAIARMSRGPQGRTVVSRMVPASAFDPDRSRAWPYAENDAPVVRMMRHVDLTAQDRARWAALSLQAGAANIFAQDWFMDASLRHSLDGRDAWLAVVSHPGGAWLGVMPLRTEGRFGRWPARVWRSWSGSNQFLGTPLVDVGSADLFWKSLLAFLDSRAGSEILLHFQGFDADDPVTVALLDRCNQEGRAFEVIHCVDRPAHRAGISADSRGDAKLRGRLRNLERRLERDHGPVAMSLACPSLPCAPWIEAFLEMEASGWKGRIGSALESDIATAGLFRSVIERGHADGSARLATLTAGGRVVAMSSWFESATWGHGFKMTFDEAFRAYAPGQLLMREISDRVAARADLSFDTCVPRDSSSSHKLWKSSRRIIDGAVAVGSTWQRLHFGALIKARAIYAALKARMQMGKA